MRKVELGLEKMTKSYKTIGKNGENREKVRESLKIFEDSSEKLGKIEESSQKV